MNLVAIKENTKLALTTLVAHKLRTFLTILGVFVGVVVIIDVAAALNGFRQSVVEQAESFSTRNVYLHRLPFVRTGRIPSHILNRKPLVLEDAWVIKNEVPLVEHVAPGLTYEMLPPPIAKYKNYEMRNPQLVGGFPEGEIVMNKPLGEGRYITESDNRHRAYVCVLGFNVVEALFPHIDPIGKEILIDGRKFTVI
jgi:putative ABC transport system permease protein